MGRFVGAYLSKSLVVGLFAATVAAVIIAAVVAVSSPPTCRGEECSLAKYTSCPNYAIYPYNFTFFSDYDI